MGSFSDAMRCDPAKAPSSDTARATASQRRTRSGIRGSLRVRSADVRDHLPDAALSSSPDAQVLAVLRLAVRRESVVPPRVPEVPGDEAVLGRPLELRARAARRILQRLRDGR